MCGATLPPNRYRAQDREAPGRQGWPTRNCWSVRRASRGGCASPFTSPPRRTCAGSRLVRRWLRFTARLRRLPRLRMLATSDKRARHSYRRASLLPRWLVNAPPRVNLRFSQRGLRAKASTHEARTCTPNKSVVSHVIAHAVLSGYCPPRVSPIQRGKPLSLRWQVRRLWQTLTASGRDFGLSTLRIPRSSVR
jgi:hypothetical protein